MPDIDIISDELIPLTSSHEGKVSVQSITGKKRKTVLSWTKGVLDCVKLGGSWYTTREALEEFAVRSSQNRKVIRRQAHERSVAYLRARLKRGKR